MKAVVAEKGNRPSIATPARLNAPQGAMALADLFAEQEFADLVVLTLDWEGDGFTPVLVIDTVKWFPQYNGRRLTHKWTISIDDAFGADNFDNGLARQIVSDLRDEFVRKGSTPPPNWRK